MHGNLHGSEDIREQLIEVAIEQFGRFGFDGVGAREIASLANTTMSSISYHFGGKKGLYLACADSIVAQIEAEQAQDVILTSSIEMLGASAALDRLLEVIDGLAAMMLKERSSSWAGFLVREQQQPSEAFDRLYHGAIQGLLLGLEALIAKIRIDLPTSDIRVLAISILGQALFLRAARATVGRALGVTELGANEITALRDRLRINVLALCRA